jgi:hypothetical protein
MCHSDDHGLEVLAHESKSAGRRWCIRDRLRSRNSRVLRRYCLVAEFADVRTIHASDRVPAPQLVHGCSLGDIRVGDAPGDACRSLRRQGRHRVPAAMRVAALVARRMATLATQARGAAAALRGANDDRNLMSMPGADCAEAVVYP